MIFYIVEKTYFAKTCDNKFYKLGFRDFTKTEWMSGAWEIEINTDFNSHKGKFFEDHSTASVEGEYLSEICRGELHEFLQNQDHADIHTMLDWAHLSPDEIDTFYICYEGEDAGYAWGPSWDVITSHGITEPSCDDDDPLVASLPSELLKLKKLR